jgi:hypothetical protein
MSIFKIQSSKLILDHYDKKCLHIFFIFVGLKETNMNIGNGFIIIGRQLEQKKSKKYIRKIDGK